MRRSRGCGAKVPPSSSSTAAAAASSAAAKLQPKKPRAAAAAAAAAGRRDSLNSYFDVFVPQSEASKRRELKNDRRLAALERKRLRSAVRIQREWRAFGQREVARKAEIVAAQARARLRRRGGWNPSSGALLLQAWWRACKVRAAALDLALARWLRLPRGWCAVYEGAPAARFGGGIVVPYFFEPTPSPSPGGGGGGGGEEEEEEEEKDDDAGPSWRHPAFVEADRSRRAAQAELDEWHAGVGARAREVRRRLKGGLPALGEEFAPLTLVEQVELGLSEDAVAERQRQHEAELNRFGAPEEPPPWEDTLAPIWRRPHSVLHLAQWRVRDRARRKAERRAQLAEERRLAKEAWDREHPYAQAAAVAPGKKKTTTTKKKKKKTKKQQNKSNGPSPERLARRAAERAAAAPKTVADAGMAVRSGLAAAAAVAAAAEAAEAAEALRLRLLDRDPLRLLVTPLAGTMGGSVAGVGSGGGGGGGYDSSDGSDGRVEGGDDSLDGAGGVGAGAGAGPQGDRGDVRWRLVGRRASGLAGLTLPPVSSAMPLPPPNALHDRGRGLLNSLPGGASSGGGGASSGGGGGGGGGGRAGPRPLVFSYPYGGGGAGPPSRSAARKTKPKLLPPGLATGLERMLHAAHCGSGCVEALYRNKVGLHPEGGLSADQLAALSKGGGGGGAARGERSAAEQGLRLLLPRRGMEGRSEREMLAQQAARRGKAAAAARKKGVEAGTAENRRRAAVARARAIRDKLSAEAARRDHRDPKEVAREAARGRRAAAREVARQQKAVEDAQLRKSAAGREVLAAQAAAVGAAAALGAAAHARGVARRMCELVERRVRAIREEEEELRRELQAAQMRAEWVAARDARKAAKDGVVAAAKEERRLRDQKSFQARWAATSAQAAEAGLDEVADSVQKGVNKIVKAAGDRQELVHTLLKDSKNAPAWMKFTPSS
jgi:hypothetical protein